MAHNIEKWRSIPHLGSFLRTGITFVQVGANNGRDSLSVLIKEFGWSGLLVEPHPGVFPRLLENYKGHPNLIFENVAIDPDRDSVKLNFIKKPKRDKTWKSSTRWSTVRTDRILGRKGKEVFGSINCKAHTLDVLLRKHGIEKLDWLMIDVEGHDYQVLRSIDLDKYHPGVIIYEEAHLSKEESAQAKDLLASHSYTVYRMDHMNQLAIRAED